MPWRERRSRAIPAGTAALLCALACGGPEPSDSNDSGRDDVHIPLNVPPLVLVMDGTEPATVYEREPFRVNYQFLNLSFIPASGTLTARVNGAPSDVVHLAAAPLQHGGELSGQLHFASAPPAGTYALALQYDEGQICVPRPPQPDVCVPERWEYTTEFLSVQAREPAPPPEPAFTLEECLAACDQSWESCVDPAGDAVGVAPAPATLLACRAARMTCVAGCRRIAR